MTATLSAAIAADVPTIRALLLEPRTIPDWNPALTSISGPGAAIEGHAYDLVALRGLKGHVLL